MNPQNPFESYVLGERTELELGSDRQTHVVGGNNADIPPGSAWDKFVQDLKKVYGKALGSVAGEWDPKFEDITIDGTTLTIKDEAGKVLYTGAVVDPTILAWINRLPK